VQSELTGQIFGQLDAGAMVSGTMTQTINTDKNHPLGR
jgi:hypothetical protein